MIPRLSEQFILFSMLLLVPFSWADIQNNKSSSRYLRPVLRNSRSNICPTPYFPHGLIRIRMRGKFMIFECFDGFSLVGDKYLLCKNGRWDSAVPICAKPGCGVLPAVENGFIFYENTDAAATVYCNSGYQVSGSMYSYCDGYRWDRQLGYCRETGLTVQTSCDFEVVDWCGWTNEASHETGWKRSAGVISKKVLKTGPSSDHTTGVPLNGHFIMIDSSEQFTNDSAYLFSPVYTSNYSMNACFQFYYHMFGDSVGTLAVYVKPLTMTLDGVIRMGGYFSVNGSHGNTWNEGFFKLQPQNESFQLVFGSSLGMRFRSDIAIDDVTLLNDEQCLGTTVTDENIPTLDGMIYRIDSCEFRCWDNASVTLGKSDPSVVNCDCYEGCEETSSCCPDFVERCVFNLLKDNDRYEYSEDSITPINPITTYTSENIDVHFVTSRTEIIEATTIYSTFCYLFAGLVMVIGVAIWIQRERFLAIFYQVRKKMIEDENVYRSTLEDMQFLAVNEELSCTNVSEECESIHGEQWRIPTNQIICKE
ncbi:MAM and LDL-receptor class A domain-containing protein 1-like [Toxorhynchites rutilus septentrionalis]|uniref:MAM and LDL-receptor class A domain-containing protein 1-like n=1 Tax=Toxorhynchites rutilus septentrionalis TaxID=329112 RepID=UPI0024797220|nr:MAM and LDL-receptor class A domain-containing protein 1-like [Toxorhynchites rutilus septentrionalis]